MDVTWTPLFNFFNCGWMVFLPRCDLDTTVNILSQLSMDVVYCWLWFGHHYLSFVANFPGCCLFMFLEITTCNTLWHGTYTHIPSDVHNNI